MTDQQIKSSIEKESLELSIWRKFNHYSIVPFCFLIPTLFLILFFKDYLLGDPKPFNPEMLWFIIVPSLFGIAFYFIQKNGLKLKSVETQLGKKKITQIVEKVGEELNWTTYFVSGKLVISKSHPPFLSGSWGEHITVIFDTNRVLINSICDPDKQPSVVSMGRNRMNIERLIHEIKTASS